MAFNLVSPFGITSTPRNVPDPFINNQRMFWNYITDGGYFYRIITRQFFMNAPPFLVEISHVEFPAPRLAKAQRNGYLRKRW